MKKKKIEIELLSDTCVSDGGIYNSAIDTDICQDDFGFPYIPGKRIKGCLRECALELNDWGAKIQTELLFGTQGNERGQILIGNAYIKNRDSMIETMRGLSNTMLCHPQNVLKCYSYVRTQTAVDFDTGVADDKSLRTIRVANKGLVFEAEVTFLSEDMQIEEDFEKCLAVFRHMGVSRTRGLGEVKASMSKEGYIEKKSQKEETAQYIENSTRLEYKIYLEEPMICKSVGEQEAASMDYIEGSKILGLIGQRLKDKDKEQTFLTWLKEEKVICSNAYLLVDNRRLYEIPASVFDIKNDKKNYRNKIYIDKELESGQPIPSCDKGLQLNQAKHHYVYMTETGEMIKYEVEMEERYHHSRPADKSIGRVLEGVDGSQLYQISSMKDGQVFCGFIEGDSDIIKQIYELLTEEISCFIGYGRNGEYGRSSIVVTKLEKEDFREKEIETDSFYALLKSPTIIYNDRAMYSVSTKDLQDEILANILSNNSDGKQKHKDIEVTRYVNTVLLGGYNVTWGCRKPTIMAFDKGTVLVFKAAKGTSFKIKTGQMWIGERCMEGFGEVLISPFDTCGVYQGKIVEKIAEDKKNKENEKGKEITEDKMNHHTYKKDDKKDLQKEDFIQKIAEKCFEEFLRFKASAIAGDMKNKIGINPKLFYDALKPTVSNMMLMCKEKDSVKDVWEVCEDRFGKKSSGKDKKLECAEKIIKHIRNMEKTDRTDLQGDYSLVSYFMDEFEEQYQITDIFDRDKVSEWELVYLTELLIQIKYVLRKNQKGDGSKW